MASSPVPDWTSLWLDPDGTWQTSGFKADFDAEHFRDYGRYILPGRFE